MDIAALVTWLITALGGFFMLGVWIRRGGVRQQRTGTGRLPAPVLFGHFALAAAGLVVWIVYLAVDRTFLAWTAFGLLVPVALLGFFMLARWLPVLRAGSAGTDTETPAERHFPVPVVIGHGLFAVATVLLVLLTALGVGSD
ncbi:hypothetical protein ACIGW4_12895 [Streptomyces sp. NPDC053513]|uniref:hypothetical protein n=1 Tax=unclassified Streptomyces TaxID=2593676 RepID=UPI0037D55690